MAFTVSQIDNMIGEILSTGQSVTHDGTTFRYADIDKLYALKKQTSADTARSTTRPFMRGINFSGMGA
jgi:hypothetical protein